MLRVFVAMEVVEVLPIIVMMRMLETCLLSIWKEHGSDLLVQKSNTDCALACIPSEYILTLNNNHTLLVYFLSELVFLE